MKASDKNHKQQISKLEKSHQSVAGFERSNSKLKRVEEALYKSETQLKKILENTNDVVFQLSPLGVIEYVSPKVKELYGYRPEELIGKHLKKTTPKSEMPKALKVLKTALAGKIVKNFKIDQLDKNGKIVHVEINGTPLKKNGTVIAVQGVIRDITEHKLAEKALQESEEKYRNFVELAHDGILVIQDGIIKFANLHLAQVWGGSPQELCNTSFADHIDPDELSKVVDRYNRRMKGEDVPSKYETILKGKDGSKIYVELNAGTITYQGKLADLVFTRNITERKRSEEALRKSEEKYRELINGMNDTAWVIDFNGNFIDVNNAAVEVIGYSREELLSMGPHDIDNTLDAEEIRALIKGMPTDKIQVFETTHTTKDGKVIPVEIKSSLVTYQGKSAILNIARDITDRKLAEEALQDSAEKYRAITSTAMDGFAVTDLDGRIVEVNEESCRILGYSRDEQLMMSISDLEAEKTPNEIKRHIQKVIEIGSDRFETRHHRKDGRIIDIEVSMTFMPQSKHFLVFHRDITERKRAEEALLESERKWRSLYENLPGGSFIVNDHYIIEDVNDILCTLTGFTREELVGQLCNIICPKGPHKCPIFDLDKERIDNDKTTVKTKDDQLIPIIKSARRISMGAKEGIIENFQDITEMVRAEEAVRQSEERFRALYEDNPSMYFTIDAEGTVLSVNQFGAEQMGYTVKELVGQPVLNVFYEEDKKAVKQQLATCIQNPKKLFHWEFRKVRKDGKIIWVKEVVRAIQSVDGNLVVLIVCEDITERKRADERLKANFDTLSKSLESTVSALASALEMRDPYTAGHQERVTNLACAIAEDMGLGVEQIAGIRMAGLIHDIGKINIPAEILNKPGQLTEIEYSLFKNHPQVGHDVLQTVEFPWPVAQIVLQHHERFDGSGYPQGLAGEEILLEARILAVADIVEAIASHRPYRPARGIGDALEEILHNKGRLYDPKVVDSCLRVFYEKGFTFEKLAMVEAPLPKIH